MTFTFGHFNFNVLDLEKSVTFYKSALDLSIAREYKDPNGQFTLVYLQDKTTGFQLELTDMYDRCTPYDLGECEFHLAFVCDDFEAAYAKHSAMGCICMENKSMGIYFIEDPDGYWIEVLPKRS